MKIPITLTHKIDGLLSINRIQNLLARIFAYSESKLTSHFVVVLLIVGRKVQKVGMRNMVSSTISRVTEL